MWEEHRTGGQRSGTELMANEIGCQGKEGKTEGQSKGADHDMEKIIVQLGE